MLIGLIAEELLLPEAGSGWSAAPFIDADSFPFATLAVPGFLLLEGQFVEDDVFYEAFVTAGQGLFPQLFTDSDVIYAAIRGAIIPVLAPALVRDNDLFSSPTVLSNVLGPSLVIDDDLFGGTKKLTQGKASINQTVPIDSVLDFDTIYGPLIEQPPLNYLLSASIAAGDAFFTPDVCRQLTLAILTDTDVIYATSRFDRLRPSRVFDSDAVFPGSFGGLGLLPGLPIAADLFFAPTITGATVTLAATLFSDGDTFFIPAISAAVVTAGLVTDTDNFYSPSVSGTLVLIAGIFTDTNTFFAPTVTQTGFDGTLSLDGPIMPSTPQPTVIFVEG